MTMSRICSLVILIGMVSLSGCKSLPKAKAVTLAFNQAGSGWNLRVNRDSVVSGPAEALSNIIVRLDLKGNDVLLLERANDPMQPSVSVLLDWLSGYCVSNQVALYVYPKLHKVGDTLSVPIFHWIAPYSNPRDLQHASFFLAGDFLGTGMNGFETMLHKIEKAKLQQVFILGSAYDWNTGFGPLEEPFEDQRNLLENVLKKSATEVLLPSQK